MDAVPGYADAAPVRTDRFHLVSVLAILLSVLFISILAVFTGDLASVWPLYLIPVVIGALAYGVPGAVLVTAADAAVIATLLARTDVTSVPHATLYVGMGTFLACGVVAGVQSSRSRAHALALEQASERDARTGLYKPAYLLARLAEETLRAARNDVEVGLMLVRIDELEGFHQQFGAYKTGVLLEHMADIVRIAVRETDIVGRYTADAFAIVLPFAAADQTTLVAERVQKAVCDAEFEGDVVQPAVRCTVSVSSAAFPGEAGDAESLVALVEQRLGLADEIQVGESGADRFVGVATAGGTPS